MLDRGALAAGQSCPCECKTGQLQKVAAARSATTLAWRRLKVNFVDERRARSALAQALSGRTVVSRHTAVPDQ